MFDYPEITEQLGEMETLSIFVMNAAVDLRPCHLQQELSGYRGAEITIAFLEGAAKWTTDNDMR